MKSAAYEKALKKLGSMGCAGPMSARRGVEVEYANLYRELAKTAPEGEMTYRRIRHRAP